MKILLFLSAIISGAIGLLIFVNAQGGIHEATGAAILVISAVCHLVVLASLRRLIASKTNSIL